MKTLKPFAVVALAVGVLSVAGCFDTLTIAPSQTQDQNHHNNPAASPAPSPAASASPKVGSSVVDHVTVNGFANGEKCPSNIAPANQNGKIRLGCELAVTCNPRDAQDHVILDDNAPPTDYFRQSEGLDVATFARSSTNTYNGDVTTQKTGVFALECSVVGKASGPQRFEVIG